MINKVGGKLKTAFQKQEVAPDPGGIGRTVQLAELEMRRRRARMRIGFRNFLMRQFRFIGIRLWAFQGLCLTGLCLLLASVFREPFMQTGRQVTLLLCCCSVVIFMTAVPFLYRSYFYGMFETEAACRFSVPSLLCARLLAVAAGDTVMLGCIFFLTHIYTQLQSGSILLCLTVPYLSAGSVGLYLLGHSSPGAYAYGSTAVCAVLSAALFFGTRFYPNVFIQGFTPQWTVLYMILLLFFITQLRHIGRYGFRAERQLAGG